MNLNELQPDHLRHLPQEEFEELLRSVSALTAEDRRQNQLLFYEPASNKCQAIHDCTATVVGVGGGNGSSKTETVIVDLVMCATGVFPYSQRHLVQKKFRGPIQTRIVVESLTTTLETIIIPKLQWWKWTGVDKQGGERGHWGWIPKNCLIDGEWEKSWSSKLRVLKVLCRDPHNPDKVLGESSIQFMSVDMDPSDFASGDFHIVIHDEPPRLAQWRENEARTMRVRGRLMLSMTWPDDPAINVGWIYDEIYEPGLAKADANIAWFELWTTENRNLDQEAVGAQAQKWSKEIENVRIYGRPIRFSNRVHPDFTDSTKTWCFPCGKAVIRIPREKPSCGICGSENIIEYNHVQEFDTSHAWPTVFLLDPHPRKPHMMMWVQIDPSDDWWVVSDGKCEGDCADTKRYATEIESRLGLFVPQRICDPNMGASPSGQRRDVTWQDEFASAGLHCELGNDIDIGRSRLNTMLKPDPQTLRPRVEIHPRCKDTVFQMNRYVWSDFSKNVDRDLKQTPKDTHDDFPTLLKYLANSEPRFAFLRNAAPVLTRAGQRRGAY